MKLLSILFSLFLGLALSQPVWAFEEADVQKLLKTKSCPACNLSFANFDGADLSGADFGTSSVRGLKIRNANLTGAILSQVNNWSSSQTWVDLSGSNLTGADMRWLREGSGPSILWLHGANLTNADLRWSFLKGEFEGANLTGANLVGATIRGNFKDANLTGADLRGTNLRRSTFVGAIVTGVLIDTATYLPKSFFFDVATTSGSPRITTGPSGITETPKRRLVATGTAFVVNKDYLLTASHVVDDCGAVSIRHSHEEIDVEVAAWDSTNDLGLLKSTEPFEHTASFRGGEEISLGDTVINYGYPLFGELSDFAKISKGEINSLSGMGNDSSVMQYDAATQPGNSGGPVLDLSGNVVGIVRSGHSEEPNIYFAIKSYVAEGFLSANGVAYERAESKEDLKTAEIAKRAERFTVLVGCWQ